MRKRIAIFASGRGSNAVNIIRHFRCSSVAEAVVVISNRHDAEVLGHARELGVECRVISRDELSDARNLLAMLNAFHIDYIVLAGFLLRIPACLIDSYEGRIVNIHPSLLPRFGGKGMYGRHVHEAVVAAGERISGITVHLVTERFDEGRILFQATVDIDKTDTPHDVASKVLALEHRHFPEVVERWIAGEHDA